MKLDKASQMSSLWNYVNWLFKQKLTIMKFERNYAVMNSCPLSFTTFIITVFWKRSTRCN